MNIDSLLEILALQLEKGGNKIVDGISTAVTAAWDQMPDIFQQIQTYFFVYHVVTLIGALLGSITLTSIMFFWWRLYLNHKVGEVEKTETGEYNWNKKTSTIVRAPAFHWLGILGNIVFIPAIVFSSWTFYSNLIGAINVKAAPKAYLLMKVVEYRKGIKSSYY